VHVATRRAIRQRAGLQDNRDSELIAWSRLDRERLGRFPRPRPKLLESVHCRAVDDERIERSRGEARDFHEQEPTRPRQADVRAPRPRGAINSERRVNEASRSIHQVAARTRDAQLVHDGMSAFPKCIDEVGPEVLHVE